jgi:hypothetical protein
VYLLTNEIVLALYTACSPAQATPAPSVVPEQSQRGMSGATQYAATYAGVSQQDHRQQILQPRVVCEPLNTEILVELIFYLFKILH